MRGEDKKEEGWLRFDQRILINIKRTASISVNPGIEEVLFFNWSIFSFN